MESGLITLDQFVGLTGVGLDDDILVRNFFAAHRLPGTENSNLDSWLAKRDWMAGLVHLEIRRQIHRFDPEAEGPTAYSYGNSLGRFICWYALQVMQEDCGVRYHPDRRFNPDFCKPRDLFAHGIMDDDGEGGTCASMPVVYVSVLRRLGLPVYLVETRGHLFCRWDDPHGRLIRWPTSQIRIPPDRFNVDGAGEGIAFHPDPYYVEWPERWKPVDYRHGRYLRSLNSKEELAQFLIQRGLCLDELGRTTEALMAYHFARQVIPDDSRYNWHHAKRSREYLAMQDLLALEIAEHAFENANRIAERQQITSDLGHDPSCQCFHCNQARAVMQPARMPRHNESCQCANCRTQQRVPAHSPSVGAVTHYPQHTIPNFNQSVPLLPGF